MNKPYEIVSENRYKIHDDNIFFLDNIPKKKLRNAIKVYANISNNETPLVLIDDTIFGSAKNGLLLTDKAIYIKDSTYEKDFCPLEHIKEVTFNNGILTNSFIINKTIKIDFTQPSKKAISLFTNMIANIVEINIESNTSWTNIGIGAGIGALFGGPIGAAVGAAIGAALKNEETNNINSNDTYSNEDKYRLTFIVTLTSIMAKMAKADGVVKDDEAKTISKILDDLDFTNKEREIAIKAFKNAKDDSFSIFDYAKQYNEIADFESKEFLYSILWIIAISDSKLHENEILKEIPEILDLPKTIYDKYYNELSKKKNEEKRNSQKSFSGNLTLEECYIILDCQETDDMKTIKRKYLKLIAEYHPDKIQSKGLPEGFIKFATEQVQKLNLAYDTIKKFRQN